MHTTAEALTRMLTVREVAATLGLHPHTVRRKIAAGEIPAVRLGGPGSTVRIPEADLERWLWADSEGDAA